MGIDRYLLKHLKSAYFGIDYSIEENIYIKKKMMLEYF